MSELNLPKLNRASRESQTRETNARRKPWAPPSRLDAPPPEPGYRYRWIRSEAGGMDDRINVSSKLREGYELVRSDSHAEYQSQSPEDGKHAGVISVGSLLLAKIPEETAEERRQYYASRTHDQLKSVDNELMKANAHSSMKINTPQRQSKVSFGGSRSDE